MNFSVNIPELDPFPAEKREQVLKECIASPQFIRRVWGVRAIAFGIWLALVLGPAWLVDLPVAKNDTQAIIYTAVAFFGIGIVVFVVPFFADPMILRRLIRERLPDANHARQLTRRH